MTGLQFIGWVLIGSGALVIASFAVGIAVLVVRESFKKGKK